METKKSSIRRDDNKAVLELELTAGQIVEIVLTEDNPNNVKNAFNLILKELKKGNFKFELNDEIQDLYYHISKEYILQLNSEIDSTYLELQDLGLTEEPTTENQES